MNILNRYRAAITLGLLPFLAIMLLKTPAWAGLDPKAKETAPSGVEWKVKNGMIIITYALKTNADVKTMVSVVMKNEADSSFRVEPVTVQGDIGEGYFAGTKHEIWWNYLRDHPAGFPGNNYFFEVRAEEIEHHNSWFYYVLGAAVVAGSTVALIMSKGENTTP